MNRTVELVTMWGDYEQRHPDATIEDFCRAYLAGKIKGEKTVHPRAQLHPDLNGALIKTISRIGKFQEIYANKALEGTGLQQIEEFGILVAIYNLKDPIKSEAIFSNMLELSSGTNILIRLKGRRLISEYAHADDKRVKRLRLTPKGEKVLQEAKKRILSVVAMLTQGMTDDDKQLCLQLLKPVDLRFTPVIQKQKNKPFDDIYRENMRQPEQ